MTDKDDALVEELAKAIYPGLSDFAYSTRLTVACAILPIIERERQSAVMARDARIVAWLRNHPNYDYDFGPGLGLAADALQGGYVGRTLPNSRQSSIVT